MKEIFSISTGVDVAKPSSKTLKDVVVGEEKSSSKDFLSIMFAQIKESIQLSKEDSKLSLKLDTLVIDETEDTKIDLSTKGEQKSFDNHLIEDLLKVVSLIKSTDSKAPSFPSLSNTLVKLINNETALKELKGINNITDLLKLSKKYDLGLEKISVKNLDLETLKKEFPVLAKKEFFVTPKEEQTVKNEKILVETKKETVIKPTVLSISNIEKPKTEIKKEPTLFEKIMSSPKDEKKDSTIQVAKEIIKEKIIEDKKENIAIKVTDEVKKTTKIVMEETSKVVVKEEQKELKTKVIKEELHVKVNNEVKIPDTTRINEPKVEINVPKKGLIENILQNIKSNREPIAANTTASPILNNLKEEVKLTENSDLKIESTINKNELKPQIKTETLASKQLSPTKDTFNNFATEFKEKLENYKPPFMRVQMALNPKGLGEVDVTIVNRGNNLHVNITSNTNTMSVFTQNQAEFKNSLVNMGFTNLEMNFSDQREKNQQQNKNDSSSNDQFDESYDELNEEETTNLELIVPQYV